MDRTQRIADLRLLDGFVPGALIYRWWLRRGRRRRLLLRQAIDQVVPPGSVIGRVCRLHRDPINCGALDQAAEAAAERLRERRPEAGCVGNAGLRIQELAGDSQSLPQQRAIHAI
jgi:hypothetical protein